MSAQRTERFRHPDGLIQTVEELSSTVVLGLEGDIDLGNVQELIAGVERVDVDHVTLLVIDLNRVGFLDLSALKALFQINDDCRKRGVHLTVITPRSAAGRIFTLTQADRVLDLVDAGVGAGR